MRSARHAVRKGEVRNSHLFWSEKLNGRDHSENLVIDGRIILEWILRKFDGKLRTGCIWFRVGTSGGLL